MAQTTTSSNGSGASPLAAPPPATPPRPPAVDLQHPAYSEAPASLTLKIAYKGYSDILFTLRDSSGIGLLEKLDKVLDRFDKMGITPNAPRAPHSANAGAPACEFHGPMKRSNKFNGWYCPKKMGDGSYCKSKVED